MEGEKKIVIKKKCKKSGVESQEHREALKEPDSEKLSEKIQSRVETKTLLVEGKTDKSLYSKFVINPSKIDVLRIGSDYFNKERPEDDSDFQFYRRADTRERYKENSLPTPDGKSVDAKKAIICTVIKHYGDDKKLFFGIVDKDYNADNNSFGEMLRKTGKDSSIKKGDLSKYLQNTDEANDVESLMISRNPEFLLSILNSKDMEKIKTKTSKMGFFRYEDYIKNPTRRRLTFRKFKDDKSFYYKYLCESEGEINYLLDIITKNESDKQIFTAYFNNDYDEKSFIKYCNGHDFTGITASIIYSKYLIDYDISKRCKSLETLMAKYSDPAKFIDTEVYKFIEKFSSMPKLADVMAVYAFFLAMNVYKNKGQNIEQFITENLELFSRLTGKDLLYLKQKKFNGEIINNIIKMFDSFEFKELVEEWTNGKGDYYELMNRTYVSADENTLKFAGLSTEQSAEDIFNVINLFDNNSFKKNFTVYANKKLKEHLNFEEEGYDSNINLKELTSENDKDKNENFWYIEIEKSFVPRKKV